MGKRSVKVDTFFPRRIFSPDIWGSNTKNNTYEEYDEYKIVSKFAAKTIPSSNSFSTRGQKYVSNEQNEFGFVGNYLDENPFTSAPGMKQTYTTMRGSAAKEINYNQIEMDDVVETPLSSMAPLTASLYREVRPSALQEPVIPFTQNLAEQEKQKEIITLEQDELTAFYRPSFTPEEEDEEASPVTTPVENLTPNLPESHLTEPQAFIAQPEIHEHVELAPEIPVVETPAPAIFAPPVEENVVDAVVEAAPTAYFEPQPYSEPLVTQEPVAFIEPEPVVVPEPVKEVSEYERLVQPEAKAFAPESPIEAPAPQGDFDYFAINGTENIADPHNNSLQFANSEFVDSQIQNFEHEEIEAQNDIFERVLAFKKQILIGVAVLVFIMCAAILYLNFTGGDGPTPTPIPAELNSNSSDEKPVILVPTDKDTSGMTVDQNGNVIGQ